MTEEEKLNDIYATLFNKHKLIRWPSSLDWEDWEDYLPDVNDSDIEQYLWYYFKFDIEKFRKEVMPAYTDSNDVEESQWLLDQIEGMTIDLIQYDAITPQDPD